MLQGGYAAGGPWVMGEAPRVSKGKTGYCIDY